MNNLIVIKMKVPCRPGPEGIYWIGLKTCLWLYIYVIGLTSLIKEISIYWMRYGPLWPLMPLWHCSWKQRCLFICFSEIAYWLFLVREYLKNFHCLKGSTELLPSSKEGTKTPPDINIGFPQDSPHIPTLRKNRPLMTLKIWKESH